MRRKHTALKVFLVIVLLIAGFVTYKIHKIRTDREKYGGHGFEYMHGYSTTDFTGYHVYDSAKLVTLDHAPSLYIEDRDDMPVLDGAEACYPVYAAIAKAVYKDIAEIEKDYHERSEAYWESRGKSDDEEMMEVYFYNGKYVQFSNTISAYYRLVDGKNDLVFAARPSQDQKDYASEEGEQIMTLPIGREAFIFFVEEDNPVDNLTSEQIRVIYHGDITNWKEVGGKNQKITAFQRPESSGSQVMMKWFMKDVELQKPKTIEYIGGMGDLIKEVAQYHNEKGALGYTFRYFLTGLNQTEHVKILKIDGIEPTDENIRNGKYPAVVPLVCAYLASNDDPYVHRMLDFLLSDDGQYLIEKTGYAPLADRNVTPTAENEPRVPVETIRYAAQDGHWTLEIYDGTRFMLRNKDFIYEGHIDEYEWAVDGLKSNLSLVSKNGTFEIFILIDDDKQRITIERVDIISEKGELPKEATEFIRV